MTFHLCVIESFERQKLLACVLNAEESAGDAEAHEIRRNIERLVRDWEQRAAPIVYITHSTLRASTRGANRAPPAPIALRAGDLVFETRQHSILRDVPFRCFFDDVGAPPLVMVGSDLEGLIVVTAFDAFSSRHSIAIVRNAVCLSARPHPRAPPDKPALLSVIARFADVVGVEELDQQGGEWAR